MLTYTDVKTDITIHDWKIELKEYGLTFNMMDN